MIKALIRNTEKIGALWDQIDWTKAIEKRRGLMQSRMKINESAGTLKGSLKGMCKFGGQ